MHRSLYFSGHAHVRDCIRPDERSQVLASGRYLETLGFTSLRLPSSSSSSSASSTSSSDPDAKSAIPYAPGPLNITRRYLDTNLATYHFHSRISSASDFPTATGMEVQAQLDAYASSFNLSFTYGVAPRSYYLTRYPASHPSSLINLYASKVFKTVLPPRKGEKEPVFLFNTGAARFDIFAGNFTRDDQLAVIPFENGLWAIKTLSPGLVRRVESWLNSLPGEPELATMVLDPSAEADANIIGAADFDARNAAILRDSMAVTAARHREAEEYAACLASSSTSARAESESAQAEEQKETEKRKKGDKLTYGYVTADSCPGTPDDTPHRPLPAYDIPDFVLSQHDSLPPLSSSFPIADFQSRKGSAEQEGGGTVDLVFYEFIAPLVLRALNVLQKEKKYNMRDVQVYSELKANELLGEYARIAWNG